MSREKAAELLRELADEIRAGGGEYDCGAGRAARYNVAADLVRVAEALERPNCPLRVPMPTRVELDRAFACAKQEGHPPPCRPGFLACDEVPDWPVVVGEYRCAHLAGHWTEHNYVWGEER